VIAVVRISNERLAQFLTSNPPTGGAFALGQMAMGKFIGVISPHTNRTWLLAAGADKD
jgi:hypothetical protein